MQLFKHIRYNIRYIFSISFLITIAEISAFFLIGNDLLTRSYEWAVFLLNKGLEQLYSWNWTLIFLGILLLTMYALIKDKISVSEMLFLQNARWTKKEVYGLFAIRICPFTLVLTVLIVKNIVEIDCFYKIIFFFLVGGCFTYGVSLLLIAAKVCSYGRKKSGSGSGGVGSYSIKYKGRRGGFLYKSFYNSNVAFVFIEISIVICVALIFAKLGANEFVSTFAITWACMCLCSDTVYKNIGNVTFLRNVSIDRKTLANLVAFASWIVFSFGTASWVVSKILFYGINAVNGINMVIALIYGMLFFYCSSILIITLYPIDKSQISRILLMYMFSSLIPLFPQVVVMIVFGGRLKKNKVFMFEER